MPSTIVGSQKLQVDRNAHTSFKEQRRRGHIILNSLDRFIYIRFSGRLIDMVLPAAKYQQERSKQVI
jgi:hypothetical protein